MHGDDALAIGIYGSTARGDDGLSCKETGAH
jgi:hypothetical protein